MAIVALVMKVLLPLSMRRCLCRCWASFFALVACCWAGVIALVAMAFLPSMRRCLHCCCYCDILPSWQWRCCGCWCAGFLDVVEMALSPLLQWCHCPWSTTALFLSLWWHCCCLQSGVVALVAMVLSSSSMRRHPHHHCNGIVALVVMVLLPLIAGVFAIVAMAILTLLMMPSLL